MILVSSYPKSGATWFQFLIYACYNGAFQSSRQIINFYPSINRDRIIEKRQKEEKELFVKSHANFHKTSAYKTDITPYKKDISSCIYLVRHPLDVMVSLVNHHQNQGAILLRFKYKQQQFFQNYISDNQKVLEHSWNYHINSWLSQEEIPIKIIKYEDLLKDPIQTLMDLNENLHLGLAKESIITACKLCSLNNLKALEQKELKNKKAGLFYSPRRKLMHTLFRTQFVNKGKSKVYQDSLNAKLLSKANKALNNNLTKLGYPPIYYSDIEVDS